MGGVEENQKASFQLAGITSPFLGALAGQRWKEHKLWRTERQLFWSPLCQLRVIPLENVWLPLTITEKAKGSSKRGGLGKWSGSTHGFRSWMALMHAQQQEGT